MSTTIEAKKTSKQGYYYLKYTIDMIKNIGNYRGRTNRTNYWIQILEWLSVLLIFLLLSGIVALFPVPSTNTASAHVLSLISDVLIIIVSLAAAVFFLGCGIARIALKARRNHDFNASGWWTLFCYVPYAGFIVTIVFGCLDPNRETNRFGPQPGADNLSTPGIDYTIEPEQVQPQAPEQTETKS